MFFTKAWFFGACTSKDARFRNLGNAQLPQYHFPCSPPFTMVSEDTLGNENFNISPTDFARSTPQWKSTSYKHKNRL